MLQFSASHGQLSAKPKGKFVDTNALANVTVLGVSKAPKTVTLNGGKFGGVWGYDAESKVLVVTGLEKATKGGAWKKEWVLKWS